MKTVSTLTATALGMAMLAIPATLNAAVTNGSNFTTGAYFEGIDDLIVQNLPSPFLGSLPALAVGEDTGGVVHFPDSGAGEVDGTAGSITTSLMLTNTGGANFGTHEFDIGTVSVNWKNGNEFEVTFNLISEINLSAADAFPNLGSNVMVDLTQGIPYADSSVNVEGFAFDHADEEILSVIQVGGPMVTSTIFYNSTTPFISPVFTSLAGIDMTNTTLTYRIETNYSAVPLPASAWMLLSGASLLGAMRLRARRKAA
ncbi:VPLPA-CTERM sorting domain-containing protein [Mangrovicoccus ximenensis]|uniref:VPLPA-CTERM sorting domain-containing protein n=1 Tax=Mangrovicoccus ximenensis TaxID=1911570 RepID=UPI0011AEB498|nr:VPLPA-CTERM sorting domain-containing protein [Mangrovicoccus ximenensis]